jgi:hypothetical protein
MENSMQTKKGVLRSWGPRGYGRVSARNEVGGTQFYFLHVSRIIACTPAEPYEGCVIEFETDDVPMSRKDPYAYAARVYDAPIAGTAAVRSALSGVADASQSEAK